MDQLAPEAPLIGIGLVGAGAGMMLVTRAVIDLLRRWRRWVVRLDDVDAPTVVANLHRLAAPAPADAADTAAADTAAADTADTADTAVVLHLGRSPETVAVSPTRSRHSRNRCASHQGALLR